jgi:predicted phage-related endonuclease
MTLKTPITSDQACMLLRMSLSEAQFEERKKFIGGSDIAAVCGMDPYKAPIDVYLEKAFDKKPKVGDEYHIERGNFYEQPTADWWAYRRGAIVQAAPTLKHPSKPFGAHPDFIGLLPPGQKLVLSIKVPGPSGHFNYGEDGSQDVPVQHIMQLQWELMLSKEIDKGELAAPIHGNLRIYPFDSDRELQGMMSEVAEKFWRDHVLKKIPPPPDASDSYADFLQKRFSKGSGELLTATEEMSSLARKIIICKEEAEVLKGMERESRNKLTALIGSARGFEGDFGRATMVEVKPSMKFDASAAFEEMASAYAELAKEMRQKHLKGVGGYRYLKVISKEVGNGK